MKLLHTSDWHVGKAIRGHSRAGEHRAVLAEISSIAAAAEVDLVVVAGDLFDTAAPTAESERIVYDALLALADTAPVVVIAGNHDNARRLDAVSRLLALGRVTVSTAPRAPADGGVVELDLGGVRVRVALLPFVSQRAIIRAKALMDEAAFRNAQTYSERLQAVLGALTSGFTGDAVNLVVAHAFVAGGVVGGGERAAHLVEEYAISAVDFPATASYVALGHLHRPQVVAGATAIHYCGSPLQLDFGEQADPKQVNVVTAQPGLPAKVTPVVLDSGRQLLTVSGTVDDLRAQAEQRGDELAAAWLRVRVAEPSRAGLADEVRAVLGDSVVDVRVDVAAEPGPRRRRRDDSRSPSQLFADYLDERQVVDARLQRTFDALHDELYHPADVEPDPGGSIPAGPPADAVPADDRLAVEQLSFER
ncbi:MAG: exonuclease subunit SbcD [Acidimicrobiia bacterium]|nr:exonuclease subunit SbcD [Acidimicrobiia bacterium]